MTLIVFVCFCQCDLKLYKIPQNQKLLEITAICRLSDRRKLSLFSIYTFIDHTAVCWLSFTRVPRGGEADPVLSPVEDAVVLRQKHISQNPQRPLGGHDVHRHETAETELLVPEHLLRGHRYF